VSDSPPFCFDFVCRKWCGNGEIVVVVPTEDKPQARCQEKPAEKKIIILITHGALTKTTRGEGMVQAVLAE
jgi:hypothetical protein